jgi:deoxyadenosine/deoxycytidine kinase
VDTLIKRIQSRGRDIESSISRDYLALLESYYDDWTSNFDLCPILTIRTDDLDFVHEPRHLNTVVKKIKEKLAGREEIVF